MHRPYYSANEYYREIFGKKIYKISLNGGFSCPNRDGTIDTRGCIFCSEGGSGDFAANPSLSIAEQIADASARISAKYPGSSYIAYFQAFTGTYAPVDKLRKLYTDAINDSRIIGLSIATRPDCLEQEKIELLKELSQIKPVWVELGLQTINETTAGYIRRGYPLTVFEDALQRLKEAEIPVIVHVIIGFPGETHDDWMACAKYLADHKIHGIKLQLLHVLRNTDLALEYEKGAFNALTLEEYAKAIVDIIEIIPSETVIYRITGDGPKKILIAPEWSGNKKNVLNRITKEFNLRNTYQGKECKNGS